MFKWIRRVIARTKNFNMFRSVWFSNLDVLVDNIRYLQDDYKQCKQRSESCKPYQSVESKQRDQSSHYCTNHSTRTCNCTGHDCIDNDSRNADYFGSHCAKHLNDSANEYNELYIKLKYYDDIGYRQSVRSAKG